MSSNIRSPSFVKKSFQGTSRSAHIRDNFSSNYVFEQENMTLRKVREFLSIIYPTRKPSFNIYTAFVVLEKCRKHHFPRRVNAPLE